MPANVKHIQKHVLKQQKHVFDNGSIEYGKIGGLSCPSLTIIGKRYFPRSSVDAYRLSTSEPNLDVTEIENPRFRDVQG